MSQYFPFGEFENLTFPINYPLPEVVKGLLHTPDDNDNGLFIQCDLHYPAENKQITESFLLYPYQTETRITNQPRSLCVT